MENEINIKVFIKDISCPTCKNMVNINETKNTNVFTILENQLKATEEEKNIIQSNLENLKTIKEELIKEIEDIDKANKQIINENELNINELISLRYKYQKIKYQMGFESKSPDQMESISTDQLEVNMIKKDNKLIGNTISKIIPRKPSCNNTYKVFPCFCPHFKYNYVTIFECCDKAYPCHFCHDKKEIHIANRKSPKYYCITCFEISVTKYCHFCKVNFEFKKKKKPIVNLLKKYK